MSLQAFFGFLSDFTFIYPVFMAYVWMSGAFIFIFSHEIFRASMTDRIELTDRPLVAVLVACFNEAENIEDTIRNVMTLDYDNFEVIAVDDGSKDETANILRRLCREFEQLRFVQLETNQGKAMALRSAVAITNANFILAIDADVLLDKKVIRRMLPHFINNPKVGAVTGNPRIRNRGSLLTRIQTGEFSSIIGMIKRSEASYGRIFSMSGCISMLRRSALHDVGYWQLDMATEDVDISWRLQLNGWLLDFEPAALCWVLMPETLKGLWGQRLRWATGGAEVLIRYFPKMFRRSALWMWPIYFEYVISILWAFSLFILFFTWVVNVIFPLPQGLIAQSLMDPIVAMVLVLTFMLQALFALLTDSRYESGLAKKIFWMVWYPAGFWIIMSTTCVFGFFRAFGRSNRKRATWVSPDRGRN